MKKYDYVIFDFDGTVADTGEGILKSLQYSFEQMGQKVPTFSELKRFIGPPIHYSYVNFYSVSEDEVELYIQKYRERYRKIGIYECFIYDGVEEMLKKLRENGVKLGIASSKPISLIYDVMEHLKLTEYFDAVVGTQFDDNSHAGKAQLVLESMEKLSGKKERTLMVGDRCFDIDGAAGAGVESAGAVWGYGSRQEFLDHGATYIVNSPKELTRIILNGEQEEK